MDGGHTYTQAVLVLADHVLDAAQGGLGFLVNACLHIGGVQLSLARSSPHDDHHTFAVGSIPTDLQ